MTEDTWSSRDLNPDVLARAVLLALVTLDALPEERRRRGERDDLVHVLCLVQQDPAVRERLAQDVERETGATIDLTDWTGRGWRL